ncbi:MAG: hypothetical protein H6R26_45 [Proteobacteria bacterium]|nr:hypothetical protein [Pseudomonadota bacterium]
MENSRGVEVVEETQVYSGFFNLIRMRLRHTLFGGGWSGIVERELFHRGSCVAVLLYDPVQDCVILIEQFRVGAMKANDDPWLLEIVAGAVEEGETTEQVARREALEEAGCELRALLPVYEFFTSPGGLSEKITLYCGIVDAQGRGGVHGLEEEDEDILAMVVPFAEAMSLVERGRIDSAIPIVALQWLALNRDKLRHDFR